MASTEGYLAYVMGLLAQVPDVTSRKMMGEYLLYADGKLFGGIYDDCFLVKDVPSSRALLDDEEIPYGTAKPMLLMDIEEPGAVAELVRRMLGELPEPRRGKR